MKIHNLWPINVGEFHNPEHQTIKKDLIDFFNEYEKNELPEGNHQLSDKDYVGNHNLYQSNLTIEFYIKQNIEKNSKFYNNNRSVIINQNFFKQPDEIVFRSFSEIIHLFGVKHKYTRGSKVINLIKSINSLGIFKKRTLSGCIFQKVNKSIIISREI